MQPAAADVEVYGSAMWFGVLGRLEVRTYGAPLRVTAPARRQVLAALLARPGSLVTASTLIDDLWGYAAPRSAIGSLRSHVARLRDDLGRSEDLLVTEGDGYRLCVAPEDIDAGQFEQLMKAAGDLGDAPAAIAKYDEALALWRDEAYVEFGEAPFAVHERIRLAELRSLARERRTDLALAAGLADDLIGELQQRVRTEPYRERGWEQLALAMYRAGRQADALDACRRAREVLREDLGVDPGPGLRGLEEQLLDQDPDLLVPASTSSLPVTKPVVDRCPYLGLAGYDEHDAQLFVGRERLTSTLAGRLADQSVVLLIGASGVGKSSLARAGLVPALRAGALPGSASWRIEVTTPVTADLSQLRRRIDLVVVDQAEQLFTGLEPGRRDDLVTELLNYVRYGGGRLVVVLRSDFYSRLATVDSLALLADAPALLVGPMRTDELRRALIEPAASAGLRLEDELIETVMEDVAGQPEPLPLLSEAMVRTWQRRDGDLLTLDGYRRSGGLAGALEAAAEECYQRLDDDERRAARHLLVRMAAPSGTGGWVRRRLATADIAGAATSEQDALDAMVAARLAIISDQQVELAHDALLERWPRLRHWLDERVLAAELVDHLEQAASAWRSSQRQDADLYRGPRLSAALDWRSTHPDDVSPVDAEFLDASERASNAELAAAQAQVVREVAGRRRLRRVVVALVAVVALAVAGGAIALSERGTARSQEHRAEQAALTADSSRLAALAQSLPSDQRDVALLLGAEGYELQPSDETAGGLQAALMQTPPGLDRVIRYRSTSRFPHLDHTGRLLAVPGTDGSVVVYDLVSNRVLQTMQWPTSRQFAVFSGDDRFVAAGGSDGTVVVWNLRSGQQSGVLHIAGGGVARPVFDPRNDNRLFVFDEGGAVTIWDRSDPSRPHQVGAFPGLAPPLGVTNLTVSADGRFIAAGGTGSNGPAIEAMWNVRTHRLIRTVGGAIGSFASSGHSLPIGFGDDTLVFDAGSRRVRGTIHGTGGAPGAIVSPGDRFVAIPEQRGSASFVSVFDLRTHGRVGRPLELHANFADPLAFRPDGQLVTTGPNEAAIWTLGRDVPPIGLRLDTSADMKHSFSDAGEGVGFLPGSRNIATFGIAPIVHDPVTGRAVGELLGGLADPLAAGPDGRLYLVQVPSGLGVWDVAAHRILGLLPGIASARSQSKLFGVNYAISGFVWSPDGEQLAANFGGTDIAIWNVSNPARPSGPRKFRLPGVGSLDDIRYLPDGRRLLVSSDSETRLSLIDASNGRRLWTNSIGRLGLRQFSVSPDGTTIAYDSGDPDAGQVTLLAAATGKVEGTISQPSWGGVGFVNHGQWLVVTSNQSAPAARLYDPRTGATFGVPFPTEDVQQDGVETDETGSRFAEDIGNSDARPLSFNPLVWTVDPASWIRTACNIAGRNLTPAEWKQYLPERSYRATCPQWPSGTA